MTTPILTAALERAPRRNPRAIPQGGGGRGIKKSPHNYLAEAPKNKAGAPFGNRNAARHIPENVERLARIDALVRHSKALARMTCVVARDTQARRAALAALLAEPRNV